MCLNTNIYVHFVTFSDIFCVTDFNYSDFVTPKYFLNPAVAIIISFAHRLILIYLFCFVRLIITCASPILMLFFIYIVLYYINGIHSTCEAGKSLLRASEGSLRL